MNTTVTEVPPPGFFIKEELEAREWSQSDLAYILGMSVQQLNPILSGKRAISTDMAKALGDAFDVTPEFFSNLQTRYDHYRSNDPDPSIARRAKLQEHFPIREMVKREWLHDVEDVSLLEGQVLRFFGKSRLQDVPYLAHAAKKTSYGEEVSSMQYAWLYRVHQIAKEIAAPNYSAKALRDATEGELAQLLRSPDELRYIPDILLKCGVRLIFVEALPRAKIDGACFWFGKQPVIGMSLRHDRIDNFWFVLRHEIEHVLQGHGKSQDIIDDLEGERSGDGSELPEEERVANTAASEFCTSRDELSSFIARKKPYFSERDIVGFARRIGRHPGIVVGQIHHRTKDFRLLRKHLVKIRKSITPYAPSDGWGEVFPADL